MPRKDFNWLHIYNLSKTLTGQDDANNNESVKKTVVKDQNTALYEHAMLYTHPLKKAKHPRALINKKICPLLSYKKRPGKKIQLA
jgi:hypothetical protein